MTIKLPPINPYKNEFFLSDPDSCELPLGSPTIPGVVCPTLCESLFSKTPIRKKYLPPIKREIASIVASKEGALIKSWESISPSLEEKEKVDGELYKISSPKELLFAPREFCFLNDLELSTEEINILVEVIDTEAKLLLAKTKEVENPFPPIIFILRCALKCFDLLNKEAFRIKEKKSIKPEDLDKVYFHKLRYLMNLTLPILRLGRSKYSSVLNKFCKMEEKREKEKGALYHENLLVYLDLHTFFKISNKLFLLYQGTSGDEELCSELRNIVEEFEPLVEAVNEKIVVLITNFIEAGFPEITQIWNAFLTLRIQLESPFSLSVLKRLEKEFREIKTTYLDLKRDLDVLDASLNLLSLDLKLWSEIKRNTLCRSYREYSAAAIELCSILESTIREKKVGLIANRCCMCW